MVEEILQWLKNISIFLIFMTTVLNLIPEKEDKKPVQFFLGIVMVLIFFQPVLKAGGLEQKMAQTLDRLTLEEEAAAMENVQIRAESFEKQYYVGAWEKETERQIRMYLSESGIPGAAVSVTLEPGNTGEAKEIRIEAPMRQTSIYREEQKKQREMLDEKLTEIKSVLSEVYGTDPAHIMIEISTGTKKTGEETEQPQETAARPAGDAGLSVQEEMEQRLCDALSQMDGVGAVHVVVTLESTGKKIVEKDVPTRSTTEENKKGEETGSVTSSSQDEATVYEKTQNGAETPYVVSEEYPAVRGVLVIAEGGGNPVTIQEIQEAVMALFQVGANKIKVVKMK